jgi:hypothetical protein
MAMRSLGAQLATLFLSTLVLKVSAATQQFHWTIEKKDISPDGQEHHQARFYSLINDLGFKRSAFVINGHTPGPELRLVQGDAVEVSRSIISGFTSTYHLV